MRRPLSPRAPHLATRKRLAAQSWSTRVGIFHIFTVRLEREGNCSQVISREVFCHEYGKIPRHTGQNAITEGDLECILTKLLRTE